MSYWACATVQPSRERLATNCLAIAGYERYLPRLRECRVVSGRKVETQVPLFRGYVFVLIRLQWHSVRWAAGISGMVMNADGPARVDDRIIEAIREREIAGLVELPPPPPPPRFRRGDKVRIVAGNFQGHFAIFEGMSPPERICVLLNLLGRSVRAELPAADVERVGGRR